MKKRILVRKSIDSIHDEVNHISDVMKHISHAVKHILDVENYISDVICRIPEALSLILLCFLVAVILPISAQAGTYTLPSGLLEIEQEAFENNYSLDSVIIPEGVTTIGPRAFYGSSLSTITIPDSVEEISDTAFDDCSDNLFATVSFGSYAHSWCNQHDIDVVFDEWPDPIPVLGDGFNTVEISTKGEAVLYQFTPENTMFYTLTSIGSGDTECYLYDENGQNLTYDDDSGNGDNFYLELILDEGKSYFLRVSFYDTDDTGAFQLLFATGSIQNLSMDFQTGEISVPNTSLWYCFVPSYSANYTFGSTALGEVELSLYDVNGDYLAYNPGSEEDEDMEGSCFIIEPLTEGEVYYFSIKLCDPETTGNFPVLFTTGFIETLKLGEQTASIDISDTATWYSFTPSETDNYIIASTGSMDTRCSVYSYLADRIAFSDDDEDDNFYLFENLTKDKTYYFKISLCSSDTGEFPLVLKKDQSGNATELKMGENTAEITTADGSVWYFFAPWVSDYYTLTSFAEGDTQAYLYDERQMLIASDDDGSDDDENFFLKASLEADKLYYYEVKFYGSDQTGSIPMVLTAASAPVISEQPQSVSAVAGQETSFSVSATGSGLTYEWQEQFPGEDIWSTTSIEDYEKDTLKFSAYIEQNNMKFRCVITDENGFVTISEVATLYVTSPSDSAYRALLIAEVGYEGDQARPGHRGAITGLANMFKTVRGPAGAYYNVYGGNQEYEDSSPSEILDAISSCFGEAKEEDVSLLYIAAHGVDSVDGEAAGAISTVRSTPGHRYDISDGSYYDIPQFLFIDEIATALKNIKGDVIIWIDTCGSGAGIYAEDADSTEESKEFDPKHFNEMVLKVFEDAEDEVIAQTGELRVANKFYVMSSSAHKETSWSWSSSGGLFANGIIDAIGSEADLPADKSPKDGIVTQKELYQHTYDYVIEEQDTQHVQVYPTNSEYQMFIK